MSRELFSLTNPPPIFSVSAEVFLGDVSRTPPSYSLSFWASFCFMAFFYSKFKEASLEESSTIATGKDDFLSTR